MRLMISAMAMLASFFLATPSSAQAQDGMSTAQQPLVLAGKSKQLRDPDVPFPLAADFPFPWGKIDGIWEARGRGIDALFSFNTEVTDDGTPILRAYQLDRATNAVLAQGIGFADDTGLVRALMQTKRGKAFMLYVGAFRDRNEVKSAPVTVLTLRPTGYGRDQQRVVDTQIIIQKVSSTPYLPSSF